MAEEARTIEDRVRTFRAGEDHRGATGRKISCVKRD